MSINRYYIQYAMTYFLIDNSSRLTSSYKWGSQICYYDGDNYIQHNPLIPDQLSELGKALGDWAKQGITMKYDQIHTVLGEGNFMLVVSE